MSGQTLGIAPMQFSRARFLWAMLLALVGGCLSLQSPALASESQAALIEAHVQAGEFAPAFRLAEQLPDPAQRDASFAAIARAQAAAGDRVASLNSAAEIQDDRLRASTLHERQAAPEQGAARGGPQPDFDSLIDLITSTIAPDSWEQGGQGAAAVHEFAGGVYVDAEGVLRRAAAPRQVDALAGLRLAALNAGENTAVRRQSTLRKVSLTRLEKQVQLRRALGKPPTEEMAFLAGLEKIQYVLVYPDSGDIVLAGPADQWIGDGEGRVIARTSRRPVLQLDDLVVILRHLMTRPDARFGCAITPDQDALRRTKSLLESSAKRALRPGESQRWLEQVRASLGRQKIDVYGIDPRTRVAHVLVEADYRMKLVGMGLEPGPLGVQSYLDSIQLATHESPLPLDVLRWWFTLNYDAVATTPARDAFELRGPGVQVQSENEMLTAQGQRQPTGKSEPLNQQFAQAFTRHFPRLAEKYPVYAELQNLFDLALVAALIKTEDLSTRVGWHRTCFGDPREYPVALGAASTSVETVVNHRVIHGTTIVAGASGGVSVNPWKFVASGAIKIDSRGAYGSLIARRASALPPKLPKDAWWWD